MKKIIIALLFAATFFSCKEISDTENDFPAPDISVESNGNYKETITNFEVSKLNYSKFYTHEEHENWTIYAVKFTLKNKTKYKINKFFIEDSLNIKYKNSNSAVYNGVVFSSNPKVNVKKPWLPNENREFEIYIPDSFGIFAHLSPENFQRTPETVTLNLKYNWFSIDNEGKDQEIFDLINEWKDYQQKLGYR